MTHVRRTGSLDRDTLLAAYWAAVAECDPAKRVRAGLADEQVAPIIEGRRRFGVAIGKAALAMARGAGPVERGVVIVPAGSLANADTGRMAEVPAGWRVIESAHPFVDERSVRAAREARAIVDAAGEGDVVLALISGGASALIEEPIEGLTIEELGETTKAAMKSGVPIAELNDLRATLSRVKRGGLVVNCKAPVVTLAVSDVIRDPLAIIGSGPTIGAWFVDDLATRRERVAKMQEILDRGHALRPSAVARALEREKAGEAFKLEGLPEIAGMGWSGTPPREQDVAMVVGQMAQFSMAVVHALLPVSMWLEHLVMFPLEDDVGVCAKEIVDKVGVSSAEVHGTFVFWGEPTLRVPADHGEGGRAQQLALILAKVLRGTKLVAMVIGSDGQDGPAPATRPAPAGAIVDGTTWDAIIAEGRDPELALARCDAGTVLDVVGALVVTGPTGINHGDVVVVGDKRVDEVDLGEVEESAG